MFDIEVTALQQSVCDGICGATEDVQKLLVGVFEVADRCLSLILKHLKRDEAARSGSFSAHSGNHEPQRSRIGAASDSADAPMSDAPWSWAPTFHRTADLRDYPGWHQLNEL